MVPLFRLVLPVLETTPQRYFSDHVVPSSAKEDR